MASNMTWSTLIVASAVALGACASGGATTADPGAATRPLRAADTLVATMIPTNASGNRIAGRIRLMPSDRIDELIADIDLRGGGYQNKYSWVVRAGQCGEQGQDLGTSMSYRLIETRGDGMAQMKIPVRIAIPEGRTHHVAIFSSPTSRNLVVSCGVLSRAE
jgi:hypothetical protein